MAKSSNILSSVERNIFISYRRSDSEGIAGRVYDWLCNHFDKDRIFMDIDTINGGDDFVTTIENALASCKVLIAIIGKRWNPSLGEDRMLNKETDFVRLEIATALKRKIKVIPVLVEKTTIEEIKDLPDILKPLLRRQIVEIRHDQWKNGIDLLAHLINDEISRTSHSGKAPAKTNFNPLPKAVDFTLDEGLTNAVKLALSLGKPLLLAGEPGVGKSLVAYKVAQDLKLQPLVHHFKSTSKAQDILYSFDERLFNSRHSAQYLTGHLELGALGLAILLTLDKEDSNVSLLPPHWQGIGPTQSVVFFEDMDKAPLDVPSDVVNEIEILGFDIKELHVSISGNQKFRPIVIITTNDERQLPGELLRYCIFYYIPFPDKERLAAITRNYFKNRLEDETMFAFINHFLMIRSLGLTKQPTTSEFIDWVKYLLSNEIDKIDFDNLTEDQLRILDTSYSILAKYVSDLHLLSSILKRDKLNH